jgi:hypothetical protein
MMNGRLLRQILDKMMKGNLQTGNARVVQDACLKLPKLYEGSCIRDLVAGGLVHEPTHQGFPAIKNFLYTLGA